MTDAYLSPVEAARRLGVSAKALRLYERHGLITPLRSASGWRAYGPEQIARLHQILALKSLGLSLARIAELLSGRLASLDALLALQEQALARESGRVDRALTLVRAARAKLAQGARLSIDDLTTLATETTMTTKATPEEMKEIFDPLIEKHYTPEERSALAQRPYDQVATTMAWDALIEECRILAAKGDPGSPEAMDLARRWMVQVDKFTGGDPAVAKKASAVWVDAVTDAHAAPNLPLSLEMMGFIGMALAKLKSSE